MWVCWGATANEYLLYASWHRRSREIRGPDPCGRISAHDPHLHGDHMKRGATPHLRNATRWTYGGLFMVALSTLMFEILLTRIFSVTMYYHFAFVAISVAM